MTHHSRLRRGRSVVWGAAAFLGILALLATQVTPEVSWTEAIAYGIIVGALAGSYELVLALQARSAAYRMAAIVGLAGALFLGWVNGAVGIIGSEDQPANRLYLGVIAIGIIGVVVARARARGVSITLFAMALAQALVPVIAPIIWPELSWGAAGRWGVFGLNAGFVVLFLGSAVLFRSASSPSRFPQGSPRR